MLASIRCIAKVAAKEEDHRCPTRAKNFVQIPQGPTLTHSHFLHDTRSLSECVRVCVCVHGCVRSEREWVQRKVFLLNLFSVSEDSAPTCTLSLSLSHLLTSISPSVLSSQYLLWMFFSVSLVFRLPLLLLLQSFSILDQDDDDPDWNIYTCEQTRVEVNRYSVSTYRY